MAAFKASAVNALTLIFCSGWGYVANDAKSLTALIPAAFGLALLACLKGVRDESKVIAHIAVALTLIVLLALWVPVSSALDGGTFWQLVRLTLMVGTCIVAIAFFIKSFRDARRARR